MKKAFPILFVIMAMACSQHSRPESHIFRDTDSLYTGQVAMLTYQKDPERALVIIDSAQVVGNVDAFTADFLRATVYGRSVDDPQKDKAISLCLNLLERPGANDQTKESADVRMNILGILTGAYRIRKDYENWIKYSIEIAELNRKMGYETEALRTEAEIGSILAFIGREEEGVRKLDEAIEALSDNSRPSVDRMDSWIIAVKRKINVLEEQGEYLEMVPLAQAILDKIEDYESRPQDYAEDSFRLPAIPEDRANYCAFYRAQALGFLARAHAQAGQLKEARQYTALFENTAYSHSFSGRKLISVAWKKLGEWDKLTAVNDEVERRMGADTLNSDYAVILHNKAEAAAAKGNYKAASAYLERWGVLNNQLQSQLRESQAQEYAAKYHQKEQEMEIAAAKADARRKDSVIIGILALFVLAALASVYYARQRRRIAEKNNALARLMNEQAEKKTVDRAEADKPSEKDEALFRSIDTAIREERLYANPSLQRQDILDRFNLRRQTLNDLMTAFANGSSFPAYINGIRLDEAVRLLREEPGMTISAVAEAVGLALPNFRVQFKQRYGMSPAEYRDTMH